MKTKAVTLLRYTVLALLILFILLCRFIPSLAEGYSVHIYPVVSTVLSAFSSLFPFSLEEMLVVAIILWIIIFPILARRKKGTTWRSILFREAELLAWVYIWFYLGWGLNYFRYSIYTRSQVQPVEYEEPAFLSFLHTYTDSLNHSFISDELLNTKEMDSEVKEFYRQVPGYFGLAQPKDFQAIKFFTFTPLYSGVGVMGSMGPFFAETQLNEELLAVQLPFTYAHEYSHLLGVSSEAEANYWAYRYCTTSRCPVVRYSGYLSLLPYVLVNASSLLPEEKYREWIKTIRPEVIEDYESKRAYWNEKYSPWLGDVQDYVYNLFLKGNNIPSGKKNYAQVVGMILSMPPQEAE